MTRWLIRCLAMWSLGVGAAFAQDAEEDEEEDVIKITGTVQKPEVVVVISRENLDKDFQLQLTRSFLDRIQEALRNPPF